MLLLLFSVVGIVISSVDCIKSSLAMDESFSRKYLLFDWFLPLLFCFSIFGASDPAIFRFLALRLGNTSSSANGLVTLSLEEFSGHDGEEDGVADDNREDVDITYIDVLSIPRR